ncbi:CFEM domain-containing protein [Colletotrichum scovillei]|uniref:CFEM domain-containing protein n=1 Tax=Colletotrichum scovillei TaxID=1209932 RepID=A0A9P7U9V1_9PEZI|nr:CFEM domain-containing protein [Colletotrichum scovillei]KAG7056465.1 CFEM domain-containing protein [Colletotrichum scovillei]
MHSLRMLPWHLLLLLGVVAAQAPSIDKLPSCAQSCLVQGLSISSCPTANHPCLCDDTAYMSFMDACVTSNCLPADALATQNYTWTVCGLPEVNDYVSIQVPTLAVFFVLASLSIFMRVAVKVAGVSAWGPDDWMIMGTYAFLIAFVPMNVYEGRNGAGQNMWSLTADQITNYFKGYYVMQALYHCTITLLKASVLFLYQRIFPFERLRNALWATQAFNLIIGVMFLFLGIFQCNPVHLAWTLWRQDARSQGTCMNIVDIGIAHGAIQVGLDIWVLALPLMQIQSLNLKWEKKTSLMAMFSLGLFLTATSSVRLRLLTEDLQGTYNFTVNSLPICTWSIIEIGVGIFTACAPSIRQFFRVFILRRRDGQARLHSEPGLGRASGDVVERVH